MCLAVPGRVTAIDSTAELRTARVDFGGVRREVCLAFVPEVEVGDYVLVHVGFAIARLDEDAARRVLEDLHVLVALDGADDAAR